LSCLRHSESTHTSFVGCLSTNPSPPRLSTTRSALFFLNHSGTPDIYTLSLHDALPISSGTYDLPFGRGKRFVNRGALLDRAVGRSEEHTSELQSLTNLVCRLLLEKKKRTDSPPCSDRWSTPRCTA